MRKLYGLLLGLSLLCFEAVLAQTQEVTGKVTDSRDGSPLGGVTVKVKGASISTVTSNEGTFRLNIPAKNKTLVFSYVGFSDVEVPVSSSMDISLQAGDKSLSEVVVVGYGRAVRRDISGSIAKISGQEVANQPVQSFETALQGKAAGVVVESGSGKVGQGIKVRIRGTSSISAGSQPLYVIDGLPVTSNSLSDDVNYDPTDPLADVNPNDIESIEVLKDASAAAIYGARAANGVILITTKKGRSGKKTVFDLNVSNTFSNPSRKIKFLDAKQYVGLVQLAEQSDARYDFDKGIGTHYNPSTGEIAPGAPFATYADALANYKNFYEDYILNQYSLGTNWSKQEVNTNWQDQLYRKNAQSQQVDLSASGGNEKTRFFVSGFYNKQDAIVVNNRFQRYGGRLNIEHSATDRLTFGLNMAVNRSQLDKVGLDNSFSTPGQLVAQLPISPLIDPATGKMNKRTLYPNGLFDAQFNSDRQVTFRTLGNAFGNLQILPSLSFRSEIGADILNLYEEFFAAKETIDGQGKGLADNVIAQSASLNTNNYFTFSPAINDNNKLSAVLGMSYLQNDTKKSSANGEQFPSNAIKNLTGATNITAAASSSDRYTFLSYFFRANYSLLDRYLLSVSVRTDGSSRFGSENRYGWFPAASVGWIVSDEEFFKGISFINFFKLRASYGLTGNAEIPNNAFSSLYGVSNYPGLPGFVPVQLGNPRLKWEKSTQTDVGLDFGLLNNRISGSIDVYKKHSSDLLLKVNIPSSTGYYNGTDRASSIIQNLGTMDNQGVEVTVTSRNIEGVFKWTTSLNVSYNKNKVLHINGQIVTGGADLQRAMEGEPVGVFYMQKFAGVDPKTGDALYYDKDGKTTNSYSAAQRTVVGKPNPDWTGGFTNTFSYKGFDLNVFFTLVKGNNIYNLAGIYQESGLRNFNFDNQTTRLLNAWQKPGDITDIPRIGTFYGSGYRQSSRFLFDGSYIRLRDVTLGYSIPSTVNKKLHISSSRLFVSGQYLWTKTDYIGDPEVNTYVLGNIGGGQDLYTIPHARSITVGLNIKF